MNKQLIQAQLRKAIDDTKPIERAILKTLQEQNIRISDAPYGLASALEHLESFREDINTALSELEEKGV